MILLRRQAHADLRLVRRRAVTRPPDLTAVPRAEACVDRIPLRADLVAHGPALSGPVGLRVNAEALPVTARSYRARVLRDVRQVASLTEEFWARVDWNSVRFERVGADRLASSVAAHQHHHNHHSSHRSSLGLVGADCNCRTTRHLSPLALEATRYRSPAATLPSSVAIVTQQGHA